MVMAVVPAMVPRVRPPSSSSCNNALAKSSWTKMALPVFWDWSMVMLRALPVLLLASTPSRVMSRALPELVPPVEALKRRVSKLLLEAAAEVSEISTALPPAVSMLLPASYEAWRERPEAPASVVQYQTLVESFHLRTSPLLQPWRRASSSELPPPNSKPELEELTPAPSAESRISRLKMWAMLSPELAPVVVIPVPAERVVK